MRHARPAPPGAHMASPGHGRLEVVNAARMARRPAAIACETIKGEPVRSPLCPRLDRDATQRDCTLLCAWRGGSRVVDVASK